MCSAIPIPSPPYVDTTAQPHPTTTTREPVANGGWGWGGGGGGAAGDMEHTPSTKTSPSYTMAGVPCMGQRAHLGRDGNLHPLLRPTDMCCSNKRWSHPGVATGREHTSRCGVRAPRKRQLYISAQGVVPRRKAGTKSNSLTLHAAFVSWYTDMTFATHYIACPAILSTYDGAQHLRTHRGGFCSLGQRQGSDVCSRAHAHGPNM